MAENITSVVSVEIAKPQPYKPDNKGIFTSELTSLLFAFGDEENSLPDSVHLLECFLIEYIKDLVVAANTRAERRGSQLQLEDIYSFLKSRPKQYNRVKQVIQHAKTTEKSRRLYNTEDSETSKKHKNN